ncbi:esterase [Allofranklinella schreckenbergeri]|uniref:Esterase n=1 Tax=Allofranklinella schreckenbergeri TaxID=1076744 RepID=A0A3M6QTB3_9BURK|nr:YqiA/YcfP family alpha/beta fold hydrolase [Allofranklinella schreckenbergeri]RMX06091.1 esterase [Allofranklinella schreckenbergeri]
MPTHLTHLLYLHGFRSSPRSLKARQTQAWFAQHHPDVAFVCPQLPPSPRAAGALMQDIVADWPAHSMAVMGSSLGGYYASWVAAHWPCPAVLLNPAVYPARDLAGQIGTRTHWHDPQQAFDFLPEHIDELHALDSRAAPVRAPQMALIAKGDEVLDWREMAQRYAHATTIVLEGGDHALSDDFLTHLPRLGEFLYTLGRSEGYSPSVPSQRMQTEGC